MARQQPWYVNKPLFSGQALQIDGYQPHETREAGFIHRPLGTQGYLFVVFHSPVTVCVGDVEHPLSPRTFVYWTPRARQVFGNIAAAWDHSWISADGRFFEKTLEELHLPAQHPISLPDDASTTLFFHSLLQALHTITPITDEAITLAFRLWLLTVAHAQAPSLPSSIPPPWPALQDYLNRHFAETVTLAEIAERFHVSTSLFCHQFKHYFEVSPQAYKISLRMHQAAFLLRDQNSTIARIAHDVGYENVSYFIDLFKRYFGISPLQMRKQLTGEDARQHYLEQQRQHELDALLREGWTPIVDCDFSRIEVLDARFGKYQYAEDAVPDPLSPCQPAPEMAHIAGGVLQLPSPPLAWSMLRWEEPVTEEIKLEVVLRNSRPNGPDLALAISGDLRTGYRLRISGYRYLALETMVSGYWDLLHRCDGALDPHAAHYHVSFWRADNMLYAELDGKRILEYPDPLAFRGPLHHSFAIGRLTHDDRTTQLHLLRAFARRLPGYVDILEPGRVLLRRGYAADAERWFHRIAREGLEPAMQQEALFLAALAAPDAQRNALLIQIGADHTSPFQSHALRQLVQRQCTQQDFPGAVGTALCLARLHSDDPAPQRVANFLSARLCDADARHAATLLDLLAQLPVTSLTLPTALTDLSPLRLMPLTELRIGPGTLNDLTPLHGMPLESLTCGGNNITDLSPLRGAPLWQLDISFNGVSDLSPLRQAPLCELVIAHNVVTDLLPIAGISIQAFNCSANRITDFSPLRGMPVHRLHCDRNLLTDLTPLASLPLT